MPENNIGISPALAIDLRTRNRVPSEVENIYRELMGQIEGDFTFEFRLISDQIRVEYEPGQKPRFFRDLRPGGNEMIVPIILRDKFAEIKSEIETRLADNNMVEMELIPPRWVRLLPGHEGHEYYFCLGYEPLNLRRHALDRAAKQSKQAYINALAPFDNQQLFDYELGQPTPTA
jgi:hypothetical protein